MKKLLLIELLGLVVIVAGALLLLVLPGRSAEQTGNSKSLRMEAQRAGRVTVHGQPKNLKRYDDLKPLVKDSAAIVVGTVQSKVSRFVDPAEMRIATDYQVDIVEVVNGSVPLQQRIDVREPAGRVDFDNGTFAEVSMPEYWNSPQIGESYIFFLKSSADGKFRLNGGPQGLFKVKDDVITPQGRKQDKLMQTYNGKNRTVFLNEIRDALK